MANNITYNYIINDRYSATLGRIVQKTRKMKVAADKTAQSVTRMGNKFKTASSKMSGMQGAMAGLGATAAISSIVKSTMKIQDAISDVGKVSEMTSPQLASLRTDLEKFAEVTGRPAAGLAQIAAEAKKIGTADKDLVPFVKTVAKAAIAFDMTEEKAGAAMSSIKSKLGLTVDQTVGLLDSTNQLANTFEADGGRMIEIIQRTSSQMKGLGVPPEAIAGFAAMADKMSVSAELGASGLKMMFNRMSQMPGMSKKMLEDPVGSVRAKLAQFAEMPEAQRMGAIMKQFGAEAKPLVEAFVNDLGSFDRAMGIAMDPKKVGSMNREMDDFMKRNSTKLKSATQKMANSMNRLGESIVPIVVIFADMVGGMAKMIGKFFKANPMIAKIAGSSLLLVGALTAVMAIASVLLPVIGAISAPVLAVVAGVALLVAAFSSWIETGNPIIQRLKGMFSSITAILSPLMNLFGLTSDVEGSMSGLTMVFDIFGKAISLALIPLQIMLKTLATVVEVTSKVMAGDWSGAWESIKGGAGDIKDIVTGADISGTIEANAKGAAASSISPKAQNVKVGGSITVAAEKGTQVTNMTPALDTGTQMRGM